MSQPEIRYDPETFCPSMPIQEAIERGFVPPNVLDGVKSLAESGRLTCKVGRFIASNEALQDMENYRKSVFAVRTPPITPEEVAAWHKADADLRLEDESIDEKKLRLEKLGFSIEDRYDYYAEWEYLAWEPKGEVRPSPYTRTR